MSTLSQVVIDAAKNEREVTFTTFGRKTGKPYDLSDACVEKGTQVAYNAAAHEATVKAVKEFLVATFRIPAP